MSLYRDYNPSIDGERKNVLFTNEMYNENISLTDVAEIQKYYSENGYIDSEQAVELLNYLVAYSRLGVTKNVGTPLSETLVGCCSPSANINYELLDKMGFNTKVFNINSLINEENKIHELCKVSIPINFDGQIEEREFILDPTFKQFCLEEGCRKERYNEEPRFSIRKSTPLPGYFLSQSEKGTEFATNLLYYGFFETTDENLKMYCDSFTLFDMDKSNYANPNMAGNYYQTSIPVSTYRNRLENCKDVPMKQTNLEIKTPIEYYEDLTKKTLHNLMNKRKNEEQLYNMPSPVSNRKR